MAAFDAYREYGRGPIRDTRAADERYRLLGSFYAGTWKNDARWTMLPTDVALNTRQIVKHTSAIVDCYQQLVYTGDLPTPTRDLPEGAMSAIPIEPQTGNQTDDDALLAAFYTGFDIWKFRQTMSLIPKTAAIFGDVLALLVDNYRRGVTMVELINPWEVPPDGLELDEGGNVKALAREYQVDIAASKAFGRDVSEQHYRFRKEWTPDEVRFYKDSKLFAYPEWGPSIQRNPYGFVPAAWFRHELDVGSDRGIGAFERSVLPSLEVMSLLSSAIDHQRMVFGAPIGVKGSALRSGSTLTLPGGFSFSTSSTVNEAEQARRLTIQSQHFLPLDESGAFVAIPYDIGQTRELLQMLDTNLIEESPEAKYAQLLAELKMATGPGVSATLAPIRAKVQSAQNNHDPQMVKICQMHVTIMGERLRNGSIPSDILRARPDRYKAFAPYSLDSYGQGKLDASIPVRDPFPESRLEKAQWVMLVDGMSDWGKKEMGVPEDEIAAMASDRQAQADREMELLSGVAAQQAQNEDVAAA